jgi:hypothetical protein
MNTKFTIETLAEWIENIKLFAEGDHELSIAWFKETKNSPFAIIAGWQECFSDNSEVDDMFCVSASNPKYCMCIKIAENEGPYAYTDYEIMNMPYDRKSGDVDDVEIMLEWEDDPEELAEFFIHEWERIMKHYGEEV